MRDFAKYMLLLDHNNPSKPSHRLTNGPEPMKTIESYGSKIKPFHRPEKLTIGLTGIHYVWRCGVVPNFLVLKVFRNYGRGEGGPKSATKYGAAQFKE